MPEGYRMTRVCKALGLNEPTVSNWFGPRGVFPPLVPSGRGRGRERYFSRGEVERLAIAQALVKTGLSISRAATEADVAIEHPEEAMTTTIGHVTTTIDTRALLAETFASLDTPPDRERTFAAVSLTNKKNPVLRGSLSD